MLLTARTILQTAETYPGADGACALRAPTWPTRVVEDTIAPSLTRWLTPPPRDARPRRRREGQPGNPSPGLHPDSRVSAPHRGTAPRGLRAPADGRSRHRLGREGGRAAEGSGRVRLRGSDRSDAPAEATVLVAEKSPRDNRVRWTLVTPSPSGVTHACALLGCHLHGGHKSTHVFRYLSPGALKCRPRIIVARPPTPHPTAVCGKIRISVFQNLKENDIYLL